VIVPHLAFHMSVARELANLMRNPIIDAGRGAFYLGSTGPDMRILSRAGRTSSHYFDLDRLERQSAIESFFEAHSDLQTPDALKGTTASFVAGYLTHLVIDEIWITDIYRPFFGPDSALGGDARANVLDRVLQYDMDLERRKDRPAMEDIREQLLTADVALDAGFIDEDVLARWREIVVDMVSRPADWERFAKTAGRFLAVAGVSAEEEIEEFMKTLPNLLEETKAHVGEERLAGFLVKANALTLKTLEDYLT
jgi:hypothetical protein